MRRAAGIAAALALVGAGAAAAATEGAAVRLQGTFAMRGTVTTAVHVYGEHRGQVVSRTWTFVPQCASGSCRRVLLARQRSGKQLLDDVMLTRRASGRYTGSGSFWVALRCEGQVMPHGGRASERISVRITGTTVIGTTTYATAIAATYTNPSRVNLTACPGGIGHDAASYSGQLASALP